MNESTERAAFVAHETPNMSDNARSGSLTLHKAAPAVEVASEPEKFWCETCEGGGMIIHQVRGECSCPDCDGKGYWTRATPATEPAAPGYVSAPSPVEDKDGAAHWKARYEARELEAHQLSEMIIKLRRHEQAAARYHWLIDNRSKYVWNNCLFDDEREGSFDVSAAIDRALAQEGAKE